MWWRFFSSLFCVFCEKVYESRRRDECFKVEKLSLTRPYRIECRQIESHDIGIIFLQVAPQEIFDGIVVTKLITESKKENFMDFVIFSANFHTFYSNCRVVAVYRVFSMKSMIMYEWLSIRDLQVQSYKNRVHS